MYMIILINKCMSVRLCVCTCVCVLSSRKVGATKPKGNLIILIFIIYILFFSSLDYTKVVFSSY